MEGVLSSDSPNDEEMEYSLQMMRRWNIRFEGESMPAQTSPAQPSIARKEGRAGGPHIFILFRSPRLLGVVWSGSLAAPPPPPPPSCSAGISCLPSPSLLTRISIGYRPPLLGGVASSSSFPACLPWSKEADSSAPGSAVKFSIWQPARVQLNPPISNFTYTTWAKVRQINNVRKFLLGV